MEYGGPKAAKLDPDMVVEVYVENDHERYERLSGTKLPTLDEDTGRRDPRTNKRVLRQVQTHAVVMAVLEVPRPQVEAVTQQLKQGRNLRGGCRYLLSAAQAAVGAAEMLERIALLERTISMQRDAMMNMAARADAQEQLIERACVECDDDLWPRLAPRDLGRPIKKTLGRRHVDRAIETIKSIGESATDELKRVREALEEKRVDVAAKLLQSMPDGDW